MRYFLGAAAVVLLLGIIIFSNKPSTQSLHRLADRVERLETIPEETRNELTRLIQKVSKDGTSATAANRNATARIERAMQFKPTGPSSR